LAKAPFFAGFRHPGKLGRNPPRRNEFIASPMGIPRMRKVMMRIKILAELTLR